MTGKNEREEISLERLMGLKIHPFSYECCSFFFLSFFSEKYLPKFYRRFWKEGIVLSGVKSRLADARQTPRLKSLETNHEPNVLLFRDIS